MKIKTLIVALLAIIGLISCSPASPPTPINTPTNTSQPTKTFTPEPTLTFTPEPTATPVTISGLEAQMVGIGTHGNMVCITNVGNIHNIEIKLKASTQQDEKIVESSISSEKVNDLTCFEITDLMYKAGVPVVVHIIPSTDTHASGEIIINLGSYKVVPFLRWIFGDNGIDKNVGDGFTNNHPAWDLRFSNETYIESVGTPIYAIGDGEILLYNYWYPKGENNGYCTNLEAWLPDVGLLWQFGHITPTHKYKSEQRICVKFNAGDELATIDSNQRACSSFPHTHSAYQTVRMSDPLGVAYNQPKESYINPFIHDPLNDGSNLPTGLWLPEFLPASVLELFSTKFFEHNTRVSNYNPVLSK